MAPLYAKQSHKWNHSAQAHRDFYLIGAEVVERIGAIHHDPTERLGSAPRSLFHLLLSLLSAATIFRFLLAFKVLNGVQQQPAVSRGSGL